MKKEMQNKVIGIRCPVLFFNNNVSEYVKFARHIWRISMESMTMTKDLQIITEANFILVLSILGIDSKN